MTKKNLAIAFYILASSFGLIYLTCELISSIHLTEIARIVLLILICIFLYLGGLLLSKYKESNKPMKINLWIFFILYLILFITLTLFDSMWGRNGLSINNLNNINYIAYLKNSINLIPFRTIIEFIKEFDSMYASKTILLNLFGNFIALMPMAFFLVLLFKKQNKLKNFIVTISIIVLGIETLQLITVSGRFDIDDFILNISGSILMYFILKIKDVNRLIKNIFLLEKNKISKKSLIRIFSSIALIILIMIGVVIYREKLYNNNYDEYNKLHNPIVKIVDEMNNTCDTSKDEFYEDEFYRYYFTCMKSDKVYVIVNNEEKYLVKDFIGSKTKYNYDINRMLERLDFYKISYIKEKKYKSLSFNVQLTTYSSPEVNVSIQNEELLVTKFDYNNSNFELNNYLIDLYLIPKKMGSTNIEVVFLDNENNILETYKYKILINENLDISYEEIKN